ncbi:hypothetical protein [Lysobacter gummosus]|uniref:hypothetical protein n=1 Tax=Lysobacter gummosus TaxID=262324 RepID=UPI00362E66DE
MLFDPWRHVTTTVSQQVKCQMQRIRHEPATCDRNHETGRARQDPDVAPGRRSSILQSPCRRDPCRPLQFARPP